MVLRQNGLDEMKFLASKKMSLTCFFINCFFMAAAAQAGDTSWLIFSTCFASLCFYNYVNTPEEK